MKIRNDLVLKSCSIGSERVVICNIVTRDLEVFQIHKISLVTVVHHPLNHSSHSLSLHCSISKHNARRTSELRKRNQRHSHTRIHISNSLVIGVEVHIHSSGVPLLLAQRFTERLDGRKSHSGQRQNPRMLQSHRRIQIAKSQIPSQNLQVRNDILKASILDFIIAVVSKNERIINGEPWLQRRSRSRSWSRRWSRRGKLRIAFYTRCFIPSKHSHHQTQTNYTISDMKGLY